MSTPGTNRNRPRLTARTFLVAVAALALLVSGTVAASAAVGVSGMSIPGITKAGKEKPKATAAKKKAAKAKAAKAKAAKAKAAKAAAKKKSTRRTRPVGTTAGVGADGRTALITCTFGATLVDEGGVNDVSGGAQKELTQATTGQPAGCFKVQFDTIDGFGAAGGNTIDACALYDTNGDSIANFAICVTVDGSADGTATIVGQRFFTCNAALSDADNCKGNVFVDLTAGTCTASVGTDPFAGDPEADDSPFDTAITCQPEVIGLEGATLLNVCSYESREPESNPEDCVRESITGSITIVKDAVPNDAQDFTFDPSDNLSATNFTLDDDGETVTLSNQRLFAALAPSSAGTAYTVSEVSVPTGWALTNIVCTGGYRRFDRLGR